MKWILVFWKLCSNPEVNHAKLLKVNIKLSVSKEKKSLKQGTESEAWGGRVLA